MLQIVACLVRHLARHRNVLLLHLLQILALHWRTLFERLSNRRVRNHHARHLLGLERRLNGLLTFNLGLLPLGAKINLNLPGLSVAFIADATIGSLVHIDLNLTSAQIAARRLLRLRTDSGLWDLAVLELSVYRVGVGLGLASLLLLEVFGLGNHLAVLATYPRQ